MWFVVIWVVFGPPIDLLGDENYYVREKAEDSYNTASAFLLPWTHENPEIRSRLPRIKAKRLGHYHPYVVERDILRSNFEEYLRIYLLPCENFYFSDVDVFVDLRSETREDGSWLGFRSAIFLRVLRFRDVGTSHLSGSIVPQDYKTFVVHLAHFRTAHSAVIGTVMMGRAQ